MLYFVSAVNLLAAVVLFSSAFIWRNRVLSLENKVKFLVEDKRRVWEMLWPLRDTVRKINRGNPTVTTEGSKTLQKGEVPK